MTINDLNGAEIDVLHKLFRFGACDSGDIPAKSGRAGLIAKGLAEVNYFTFQGEDYYLTCLTGAGQNLALNHYRRATGE